MNLFKRKNNSGDADSSDDSELETIEGERSTASVNRNLGMQARITNALVIILVVAGIGYGLVHYYSNLYDERKLAKASGRTDPTKTAGTNLPALKPLAIDAAPASPVAQLQTQQTMPGTATGQPAPPTPEQVIAQRRLSSSVFFKIESSNGSGAGAGSSGGNGDGSGATGAATSGSGSTAGIDGATGSDPLSKSLQPSHQAGAKAYLLADPSMTVTKGAVIPCNVVPALDSTLPGIVTCMQSSDVWSTDGKVVLLERGTKWVGEQKFGLAQGQKRLGMLWTRGETPNHVLIDVDSGTADHLGRPGVDGEVDNHFWDRFGGAILISLVGDVGSFLAATQSGHSGGGGNATTIAFPNTVTGAQSAMSDVLKSTLNIPPTLTKNQGATISIYVARDLDFRDVYGLKTIQ